MRNMTNNPTGNDRTNSSNRGDASFKANTPSASLDHQGDNPDRDLVTMYSRLTHTLENVIGRERLAKFLASAQSRNPSEPDADFLSSAVRTFRRIGMIQTRRGTPQFIPELIRSMAYAVSRPESQVTLILELFVSGNDKSGTKPVCGPTPQCQSCLLTRVCDLFNHPAKPEMATLSPAARLLNDNARAVSDAELLAVLLIGERATGREAQIEALLARYGRLLAVSHADTHEFAGIRGMSRPQVLRLAAMKELHSRLLSERRDDVLKITCSQDLYDRYAPELRSSPTEAAVLIILDAQNRVVRDVWYQGQSPDATYVSIRDLLRPALREYAVRVALVHNHPGTDPKPSISDLDFTKQLRAACDITGLGLVDHVIVAEHGYYSFAEEGMLGL